MQIWHLFNFSLGSYIESPISSLFHFQFAQCLKFWTLDFSSFETIYSMSKNDLKKYSICHFKVIVYIASKFWVPIRMFEFQAILRLSFLFLQHLGNQFHMNMWLFAWPCQMRQNDVRMLPIHLYFAWPWKMDYPHAKSTSH